MNRPSSTGGMILETTRLTRFCAAVAMREELFCLAIVGIHEGKTITMREKERARPGSAIAMRLDLGMGGESRQREERAMRSGRFTPTCHWQTRAQSAVADRST
jgi:hypothetical protein